MNPDDMRGLFNEALDGAGPAPTSGTDHIVTAGRRRVLRRRAAVGAGAIAGIAALTAAVAIPLAFSGRPGLLDAAGLGNSEEESGDSCEAPDDQTDEQKAVAAMYGQALDAAVTAIGGTPGGYCDDSGPNYDGFYFDAEAGGYRYEEFAIFRATGEHATVRVDVWEPNDIETAVRMESLAECGDPGVECTWDETDETVPTLLVEETRTLNVDAEENPDGVQVPVRAALVELGGGVIVHVEFEEGQRKGTLSTTPEQLAGVAQAIPVGQDAPEVEEEDTGTYTLPDDAALAGALVDGIAAQFPGAVVPDAADVEFGPHDQTEAYAEGYYYGNDGTRVAYADATVNGGEQVRFFLQVTPLESPGDGGASQEPAEHYANCSYFTCDYSQLDDSTGLVHRTSTDVRPGPTSIEFRASDGWVVGVGAESLGSTEAPSVPFEALDAIVNTIR
ncbi:hypothetical protein [Glycomyces sp. NPDC048151]|uniref:hypothetical protein n=1 Tax=Glycomyces sp. NPDC048151 TaxID=3364002 RepID=UPI003710B0DE